MTWLGDDIAAALPELRAHAESMMDTRVTVRAASGIGEWDETSGSYSDTAGAVIFEGWCSIPKGGSTTEATAGEAAWALGRFVAKFPVGATLQVGATATVTECCWNPRLAGMAFTIQGLPVRSHPVHQPAECEAASR